MKGSTVFVVDDDPSVRDSTAVLLGLNGFTTQVFTSAESFLRACREDWVGCILLDLKMPGMDGLALQKELSHRGIDLPVVIVTAHGDVATVRTALKAGAMDFLEKPVDNTLLLEVVRNALARAADARRSAESRDERSRRLARLTTRERQVMDQLAAGKNYRDIASALGISPRTVEVYRARLMEKLQVRNLAEVIRLALGDVAKPG